LITIAGFAIGISVLIAFYNLIRSARKGEVAVANPWRSRSPEWQLPSPLPSRNYEKQIEIVGEPYDYGLAGSVYVNMRLGVEVTDLPKTTAPAVAD
jgi:cytochrome c oxidase subunit 1